MSKSIAQKYRRLSDVEHALLRPGRYIGSVKPHTAETWVVGSNLLAEKPIPKMIRREITWNPGLNKLFDEVISNSVDHSKRPEGAHLDTIKVEINKATGELSVYDNGGIPIITMCSYDAFDVSEIDNPKFSIVSGDNFKSFKIDRETGLITTTDEKLDHQKKYNLVIQIVGTNKTIDHDIEIQLEHLPTMLFGYLRSGSNFDDTEDSDLTGQNGEGASLTNIFSTEFTVETADGKKKFKQTWTKNMTNKSVPKISTTSGQGFTKITFTPDYEHLETGLSDDIYLKLVKRVYDVAGCNPKLKVFLNGERIKINSFKDYIAMYVDKFEYDDNGDWQIGVAASDNGFGHVSFINTTETSQGGSHLYYIWYQIATKLREFIQKKHKIDVRQTEIQAHMQIFINGRVNRPRYDSQTKENLITEVKEFGTSWEATDKFIKRVIESGIVDRVLVWAEAKAKAEELKKLRELSKDIDKANPRKVDKFSDALSDDERHLCELYLTEGDSARKSIHEARGKNPYIGSFALKGKPLNVMDVDMKKIIGSKNKDKEDNGNNEIQNILKITGLKLGVPVKSVKDLRFGKIVILSDQDLDGFHVSSLLINFFSYFWPELFEMGVIYRMSTPLVIATVKGKETEFWTDESYEAWAKTAPKHEASRFKGLGKFKTPRFKKILENRENYLVRINKLEAIDMAGMDLAFKGNKADARKEWLNDINYFTSFE